MKAAFEKYIGSTDRYEFPKDLQPKFDRAKRLEIITILYLASVVLVMYLAMGSSQAMKAAWIEDIVSMVPASAFLIASRFYNKKPNNNFPYGYHKAFTIAFVAGSIALFGLGLYILIDSIISLVRLEHPTIGSVKVFGEEVWLGWLMLIVLTYSFVPTVVLGRKKLPYAKDLHIKILYVDSQAQKADWMTALAGMAGIIGIGFGLWWADSLAALFISFSIVKDGFERSRDGMKDLMEEIPYTYDNKEKHPLIEDIVKLSLREPWVKDVRVRFREHGLVFFGEVFVIPESEENVVANVQQLKHKLTNLHWKIEDVVIHVQYEDFFKR